VATRRHQKAGQQQPCADRASRACLETGGRETLTRSIRASRFWTTTPFSAAEPGEDGATWYIEGRADGVYHLVHRWSDRDAPIHVLGEQVVALAGLKLFDGFGEP
jgi:hypothetical protein